MGLTLKIARWSRLALIFVGSVFFALGLAPLAISGLSDVGIVAGDEILVSNIAIVALGGCGTIAGIFCLRRFSNLMETIKAPRLSYVFFGSVIVACVALVVATTDHANNTAWRYAHKLETAAGVSKFREKEFGRNFARLTVNDPSRSQSSLGAIPMHWKMWAAGGRSIVLLRIPGTDAMGRPSECHSGGKVALSGFAVEKVVAKSAVSRADICGQWQRIELELQSGVTRLSLDVDDHGSTTGAAIDVMFIAHQSGIGWFWDFCTIFAMSILLSLVYAISVASRDRTGSGQAPEAWRRKNKVFVGAAVVLFLILGNAFVYSYVSHEKTIYTWDFAGSWVSTRNVSEFINGAERKSVSRPRVQSSAASERTSSDEPQTSMPDPGALVALIRNLRFAEYNVSSGLALAPVLAVFGGSRMVYELSLLNIYGLAAVLMLIVALRASGGLESARWPPWWPLIPLGCVFCFVPFWLPILRGYVGISVVALNLAVLWLYFRRPVERIRTGELVLIGALLLASVILQRWNAYWVVAFYVLLAVDATRIYASSESFGFDSLIRAYRAPIVAGFSAFFLFATIAWPKVVTTVGVDYTDIYSAFLQDEGIPQALVRLINTFGGGLIALIIAAFIYLLADPSSRRVAVLLGLQLTLMFIHFSRTQTIGPHHMYILIPGLLIILSLALIKAISTVTPAVKLAGFGGSLLVLVSGYASGTAVFAPKGPPHLMPSSIGLLSQSYAPPLVRNDLDEFVRLARYIDTNLEEGAGYYVLGGSQTLNAAHLKNIGLSTGIEFESADQGLPSAVVDKRDGFPRALLKAQIVITSDPIQFRRPPSDQHVIRIPAESLMSGEGIGRAFERLPETFRLDGDVDLLVFRRTRPNTASEVADLSNQLRMIYPDRPDVYE